MKLYKVLITTENAIPSEPEFIMESENRDALKRKAEAFAEEYYGVLEFLWVFGENDQVDMELTIYDQCKFVVRTW
jgi:hypothetical protein